MDYAALGTRSADDFSLLRRPVGIENRHDSLPSVCVCVEKETAHNFAGKRSCTFETITMAPIQTKVCMLALGSYDRHPLPHNREKFL